jgi:hypothetical protein
MNKLDLIIGLALGLLLALIGSVLYIAWLTPYTVDLETVNYLKSLHSLGKVIALGSILNLLLFTILLKYNKIMMARGLILAVIMIAVCTQII